MRERPFAGNRREEFERKSREIRNKYKLLIQQAGTRQERSALKSQMEAEIRAAKREIFDRPDGSPYVC